jgi:hypothetical protein
LKLELEYRFLVIARENALGPISLPSGAFLAVKVSEKLMV